ncbi:TIGR02301 family protein [Parvibaculum sp.]|uniref:TIGR02301 family protein n=1 Tax=Parvibaculum sp. TaxID=2024848 RepID=UPI002CCCB02F|nr:TIGR02301 family protein [Parvibaculum sp.]HUD49987.1 TIGR02301 family protein [Parvibaculum sp.]
MAQFLCGFETARLPVRQSLAAATVALALLTSSPLRADPSGDGLARLAEILGAAHHLRGICGTNEGALWRDKMIEMLDAMAPDPVRRQVLIAHFNEAYHRAGRQYPRCTSAAATEINTLFDEGRILAARLAGTDRSAAAF